MKFLNGGWLIRDGFDVKYAEQAYDARIYDDKLIIYMPFKQIAHKGETLDGGILTMEVFSPHKDVIGFKLYNFKGTLKKSPDFEINKEEIKPIINTDNKVYSFQSGDLCVKIQQENLATEFYYKDKPIIKSTPKSKAVVYDCNKQVHISEQLSIDVGECIYGLGERFTNFIKNGQAVDIWNEDGGTGTTQAYKNIPFYLSNKNHGVFVNYPNKVSFEVGSEKVSKVQFSVPEEEMEYYVIGGDNLKNVVQNYTDLTGKPSLPPAWSFGLWLSTSFLTNYDEDTVNSFVDGMAERDIPLEVFHFDCLWMKEYEWCNFEWDKRTFPRPEEMLKKLKEKGLKICVWINPYIAQKSPLFDEGAEEGYFLKKENGDIWQWNKWQAGMAVVDFTNPKAAYWYQSHLKKLLDMGVDCFKTDFGERIPTDVVYTDGSHPQKMHNYYAYLYNKVVYDLLIKEKGKDEAIVFARSATVGSQKLPVHWGGDSTSDYPSMAESLRAGLSFGLSGFGYWSHDISGFEEGATPDLYKRWTQFGLLSSHSRYHGSWEYKFPWLYGDEAVEVTRFFTKMKLRLMPYIQTQSVYTATTGVPMMRAMVMEFPDDEAVNGLDRQYMFGDRLLVAPIFNDSGLASFYVPKCEGLWTDYLTEKKYGEGWYKETCDYFHLPLLVKPNSIIVEGYDENHASYDYTKDPTINVYELDDNAECELYDIHGKKTATINVKKQNDIIEVLIDGIDKAKLILHGKKKLEATVHGGYNSIKYN